MSRSIAAVRIFLRTSLLVLLVLGVMIRPVLNQVGDLHAASHAALAADAGAADHADTPDPDHATGSHGLMHMADTGTSVWIFTGWALAPPAPPAPGLLVHDAPQPQPQRFASPFRPPIA